MSFRLLVKTASVYRRGPGAQKNAYNMPIETEAAAVNYPCWLEQTDTVEVTVGRDTVLSDWLLVLPPEALLDATDRIAVDGRSFEVVGHPATVNTPRGAHHIECRLRAVVG